MHWGTESNSPILRHSFLNDLQPRPFTHKHKPRRQPSSTEPGTRRDSNPRSPAVCSVGDAQRQGDRPPGRRPRCTPPAGRGGRPAAAAAAGRGRPPIRGEGSSPTFSGAERALPEEVAVRRRLCGDDTGGIRRPSGGGGVAYVQGWAVSRGLTIII